MLNLRQTKLKLSVKIIKLQNEEDYKTVILEGINGNNTKKCRIKMSGKVKMMVLVENMHIIIQKSSSPLKEKACLLK